MDLIAIIKANKTIVQNDICQLTRIIDLDDVLQVVCSIVKVDKEKVKGFIRKKEFIYARHLYFYFSIGLKRYSSTTIGKAVHKDHSTALYGAGKIRDYIKIKDRVISDYVKAITRILE